jgi:disulfide bond formation protein DsbB
MYFPLVFFGCIGLLVATQNIVNSLPFLFLALVMVLVIMAFSPKVEINESGIRASSVFSSSEAKWNDIQRIQSSGMSQRLDLYKSNGQVVKVSAQVSGYPRIVEILRQKRPDLFGAVVPPAGQGNQIASNSYSGAVSAPAFTGTKLFKKSALMQYGGFLLYIPLCLISFWTVLTDPENQIVALLVGIACVVMMVLSIFQVNGVKVEPNKLTVQTLFGEKDFSAREIREIKMQSVRRRYGNVTTYVMVISMEGKKYSLMGFSEGTEIIYGFLTNWWNAYRNR